MSDDNWVLIAIVVGMVSMYPAGCLCDHLRARRRRAR